jgi:hypothetical protein|tara:strand:+ start:904 stop:1110 length:207 start_codon:yes stop_codon:yes gene_type:complete
MSREHYKTGLDVKATLLIIKDELEYLSDYMATNITNNAALSDKENALGDYLNGDLDKLLFSVRSFSKG